MGKIFFARFITEFEAGISTRKTAVLKHHDQSPSVQHTKALAIAFRDAGNHFDESSDEVVIIHTRDVMTDNVAGIIMSAHEEGQKQRAEFVAHRMHSAAVAFHALIKMNKFHLPGNRLKKRNKSKYMSTTKKDMHLLGQLYMLVYAREGPSYRCLKSRIPIVHHPYQTWLLRNGKKSDLLPCWEVDCQSDFDEADAKLVDGANVVHFRADSSIKLFRDYDDKKIIPFIKRQLATTDRVDVIWNR